MTEVEKEVVEVIEEAGAIVEETEDLVEAVEQAAEEGVSVFQACKMFILLSYLKTRLTHT